MYVGIDAIGVPRGVPDVEGLCTLNNKITEHSVADTAMWDDWMNMFGKYTILITSVLTSIALFAAILTLCGCCCIPSIRSVIDRLITTALAPVENRVAQMYPLLNKCDGENEEVDIIIMIGLTCILILMTKVGSKQLHSPLSVNI